MPQINKVSTVERLYYNKLFYDYSFCFDRLKEYYSFDHRVPDSYAQRAEDLFKGYDHHLRGKLTDILISHNSRLGCGKQTIGNIEKLKKKDSVVLVGGHQPVLFGGPLFIIYKAVTIIGMAEYLEHKLNIGVVPCFWNASDDSNTGQIDTISLLSEKGIEDVGLEGMEEARFSDVLVCPKEIMGVLQRLKEKLAPTDFRPKVIDFLNHCIKVFAHRESFPISDLFSALLLKMFHRQGLVIIDPAAVEIKSMGWEIINKDIKDFKTINNMVSDAGKKLEQTGYHAQVKSNPDTLNFFFAQEGIRHKIIYDRQRFRLNGKSYSPQQLVHMVKDNLGSICPNVILRPLVQDTVFPVLATVCGPGEVSYFAQLKHVYQHIGKKLPVIYPRFSATIVEKSVKKILEKYQLNYNMLYGNTQELESMAAKKFLDYNIGGIVDSLYHDMVKSIDYAEGKISSDLMDTSSSFDRIKRNLGKEAGVLKGKLFSEYKKQNRHLGQGIYKLKLNLLPRDNLQERIISIFSFINKYDFSLMGLLHSSFEPFDYRHKFLDIK